VVVVHGGGKIISEWNARMGVSASFVRGLRVTDAAGLEIVAAVLGGLVNKKLVIAIQSRGGKAIGISGCDGNLLQAKMKNPELGYVGEIAAVNPAPLRKLLEAGYMPIVAPISSGVFDNKMTLLNVNGDVAAGAIATALNADKLVFMTDVDGILDGSGESISKLNAAEVQNLLKSEVISGGMIPKVEACLSALASVPIVSIINGTRPRAILADNGGTTIVAE
jgi:acetylglutamate kinase